MANGMIVPIELYQAFPIAHPNCRRSAVARPDLVDAPGGPVAIPDNAERADVLLADATARLEAASSQLAAEARR